MNCRYVCAFAFSSVMAVENSFSDNAPKTANLSFVFIVFIVGLLPLMNHPLVMYGITLKKASSRQ